MAYSSAKPGSGAATPGDLVTDTTTQLAMNEKKPEPGQNWKANEEHVVPQNNIPLVFCALMLTLFLVRLVEMYYRLTLLNSICIQAALDQTM